MTLCGERRHIQRDLEAGTSMFYRLKAEAQSRRGLDMAGAGAPKEWLRVMRCVPSTPHTLSLTSQVQESDVEGSPL